MNVLQLVRFSSVSILLTTKDCRLRTKLGSIIYWGILRFAIVLIGLWVARGYVENYGDWWTFFFFTIMAVVLYPAQLAYRKHFSRVRRIEKNVMCSSCRHYAADEALCTALDEAVTTIRIPCEGLMWEQR